MTFISNHFFHLVSDSVLTPVEKKSFSKLTEGNIQVGIFPLEHRIMKVMYGTVYFDTSHTVF